MGPSRSVLSQWSFIKPVGKFRESNTPEENFSQALKQFVKSNPSQYFSRTEEKINVQGQCCIQDLVSVSGPLSVTVMICNLTGCLSTQMIKVTLYLYM